jgi:tetratricopeptide (TPR) repeat protein
MLAILVLAALAAPPRPAAAQGPKAPLDSVAPSPSEETPPSPASDLIVEARRQSDEKRFDDAAATLKRALALEPNNVDALFLLARVQSWNRRYDESIATYRALLALKPDDALMRAGYARVLAWSGRREESIREFRRAVRGDSTNLESRIGYARALSWSGDLAGASREYRRILAADSSFGDAWLGLATIARWRGAATASDAFLARAEARGADRDGVDEEREAVRRALRPVSGGGWLRTRERQYVDGSPAFTLESVGAFTQGRATIGRTVGVSARASRLHQYELARFGSYDSLNYDLRSTVLDGDLSLLRIYPVQLTAGATAARLERRSGHVRFPLGSDDDFFGARSRLWAYLGRFTPSAGIRRELLPIKITDATTGARRIDPGGVTNADGSLAWNVNARASLTGGFAKGFYSDDNERSTASLGAAYRVLARQPGVTLDYGWSWTDFSFRSPSYFTPLNSVKHAVGVSANGYSDHASLDYGARYQISAILSSNFEDIAINAWSAYADAVLFGALPVGVEGSYSVDNNDYKTWSLVLSASVRW